MKIVVAGHGLGSRTIIYLLRQIEKIETIVVLERSKQSDVASDHNSYTGLWNPSNLVLQSLSGYGELRQLMQDVSFSGYRLVKGQWAAIPNIGLRTGPTDKPSLSFVENKALLSFLDNQFQNASHSQSKCEIKYGEEIIGIRRDADTIKVLSSMDDNRLNCYDCNLLVAADGSFSRVREILYPDLAPIEFRGYKVYRGHTSRCESSETAQIDPKNKVRAKQDISILQPAARADNGPPASSAALLDHGTSSEENAISDDAASAPEELIRNEDATASSAARYRDSIVDEYSAPDTVTETTETSRWDERRGEGHRRISEASWQTWGPGARFACVPTVSGNAWFAAVTAPESCVGPLRQSASPPLPHCQWGALSNGSRPATAEEVADLRHRFQGWHDPVDELIAGADCGGSDGQPGGGDSCTLPPLPAISVCDAIAFKEPIKGGLSGIDFPAWKRKIGQQAAATAAGAAAGAIGAPGVAFIGDAAHTLDPILAQGAGLAIEDAALLAHALEQALSLPLESARSSQSSQSSPSNPAAAAAAAAAAPAVAGINIQQALLRYEQSRRDRVWKLHHLSNVAQAIGHVNSAALCSLRDWLLAVFAPTQPPERGLEGYKAGGLQGWLFDTMIRQASRSKVYDIFHKK